jgi:retron-type reverse transcriptase
VFDLIDHDLLLLKLKKLGVDEKHLPIFREYLSGRTQYVNVNGRYSTKGTLIVGVPQGSILNPVLFLTFINYLPTAIQHSTIDIYADDTTISYSSNI